MAHHAIRLLSWLLGRPRRCPRMGLPRPRPTQDNSVATSNPSKANAMILRALPLMRCFVLMIALFSASACAVFGPSAPAPTSRPSGRIVAPPPNALPPSSSAGASALAGGASYSIRSPRDNWGIGFVRVSRAVDLPLFDAPGGRHWGWFTRGRGFDHTTRQAGPASPGARLSAPGIPDALVVMDVARGGWIKVRWGRPDDLRGGTAWTRSRLASGAPVTYTTWNNHFLGANGVVFRDETVGYNVRSGPGVNHEKLEQLRGRGYDMTVLGLNGDWARVRISTPPQCGPGRVESALAGGVASSVRTGWIKWRSESQGPKIIAQSIGRCPQPGS